MSSASEAPGLFDEPLKGEFVTERLTTDLRDQITSGKLAAGSLIKPVRELMKQYRISYNSVRKALNQLADEGYLALEQGRGTFVKGAKVPSSEGSEHKAKQDDKRIPHAPAKAERNAVKKEVLTGSAVESVPEVPQHGLESEPASDEIIESVVIKDAPIPAPAGLGKRDLVVWVAQGVLGEASGGLQVALQTFQSEALKAGWSVALAPARADMGSTAARANVIWGTVDPAGWTALTEPGRICLVVGYWPQQVQVSAVVPDYFGGGHELALRMLRCGHREVAFLHDSERVPGSDVDGQLAGCRVALEETGLSLPEALVVTCPADADWLADRLLALRPRPTAVLVSGQRLAERLTGQLKERGVGVPRALSVATFGPTGEPNPLDLTSARIDWRRAGRVVLNRLRELLSGAPIERLRISLPVEFHEGSTLSTR